MPLDSIMKATTGLDFELLFLRMQYRMIFGGKRIDCGRNG